MPADWESDSPQLRANLSEVALLVQASAELRSSPSLATSKHWHRIMLRGLDVPDPALVGAFRGEPGLEDAEVHVEGIFGTPAKHVPLQLQRFEADLSQQVAALDALIPVAQLPSQSQLTMVFSLCAWTHAEWVRIHPFGNGNGRVARLWVNWLAMRYSLPPFLRLRPRPDTGYDEASSGAMSGNWRPMRLVIRQLFTAYVSNL